MKLHKSLLLYGSLALTLMATAWLSSKQTANSEVIESVSLETPISRLDERGFSNNGDPTFPTPSDPALKPILGNASAVTSAIAQPVITQSPQEVNLFAVPELAQDEALPETTDMVLDTTAPPPVPALPFVYLGKFEDKSGLVVYLMESEVLLTVAQGEQIDERYQLTAISEQQLTFHYRPLNIQQTLYIK